ncbi:MAG: hypothetical protein WBB07_09425 [Mycobacterium sp.]
MTHHSAPPQKSTRPADVDTGFWLWVVAVPLLAAGYIVDVATLENFSAIVAAAMMGFLVVLLALVVTFLMLMRQGYRWARTVLTAGGAASMVSVFTGVFNTDRPAVAAVIFAVTGIVAAVLVAGGIYQLHRKESNAFFTR